MRIFFVVHVVVIVIYAWQLERHCLEACSCLLQNQCEVVQHRATCLRCSTRLKSAFLEPNRKAGQRLGTEDQKRLVTNSGNEIHRFII